MADDTFISAMRKIRETGRGMMVLPLSPVECAEIVAFAGGVASDLRTRRRLIETDIKNLGLEVEMWEPDESWEHHRDYVIAKGMAGDFVARLRAASKADAEFSDYTANDFKAFDWYIEFLSYEHEQLFELQRKSQEAQRALRGV